VNLSEGGMALRCDDDLPLNAQVKLTFMLPGQKTEVEVRAITLWKDARGYAGLMFEQMLPQTREYLNDWITEQTTFL
jgi:hypothetical protein